MLFRSNGSAVDQFSLSNQVAENLDTINIVSIRDLNYSDFQPVYGQKDGFHVKSGYSLAHSDFWVLNWIFDVITLLPS